MSFTGILTVGLSTTPQQLFSVVLCSQNATLHTEPGNRGWCYIGSVRGQIGRSLKACEMRDAVSFSLIYRGERRPPLPVVSTPSQSVHPDRTFGSVSVLIQRLWRMNQSALRTTTSADKPVFSIWVFYWRRATPFSTCWFSLNKSWPWWRLFTGSSEMFSSSSKVKTGRSKELWDLDSSVQWEVELWPHVKDLSSIKHWWWDTWSFT